MQLKFKPPPPLPMNAGTPEAYTIQLRRHTGSERMAALDAINSGSLERMQAAVEPLIIGFGGLTDEDGAGVLAESKDDNGRTVRNVNKIFGAMALEDQTDAINAILAFVGVAERVEKLRPTVSSGSATSPNAPASSSDGGTCTS